MSKKTKSLIGKFIKGSISGGVTAVALLLADNNFVISNMTDLYTLAKLVVGAFASGAVLTAIKAYTWQE